MSAVLVTGFEPFDGHAINPSGEVARSLHDERVAGEGVTGVVLPCAFDAALAALDAAIGRQRPSLVLALGLAASRPGISVERVAINLVDARIADNHGEQPVDRPVVDGAPAARFATLPVKAIAKGLRDAGMPATLSLSAGSFVCNAVFYALLHALEARPGARGGFVHLPLAASLPLADQAQAVRRAIAIALVTRQDLRYPAGELE